MLPAAGTQGQGEEELGSTLGEGDGLLQEEVHQHLGDPTGGVADVHNGEVDEEEVRGKVEAGVQPDQEGDESVAQQGQQMGGPKQDRGPSLRLPVPGEAHEDTLTPPGRVVPPRGAGGPGWRGGAEAGRGK